MTSSSGTHIAKAPPKDPLNNETFWFYSFPLSGTLWPLRVGTPSTQGVLLKDQPRSHPGWVIEWWGPSGLWSSLSLNSGADCLPGPVIKEKAEIQFHSRNGKLWKTFFHFGGYHTHIITGISITLQTGVCDCFLLQSHTLGTSTWYLKKKMIKII